jgi:uncharacterized hydrophobic protein (TIGR00271 family)
MALRRIEITLAKNEEHERLVFGCLTDACGLSMGGAMTESREMCFRSYGDGTVMYNVNCDPSRAGTILGQLAEVGCGHNWGLVTCLAVEAMRPTPRTTSNDRAAAHGHAFFDEYGVARKSVEEIYNGVLHGTQITYEFMIMLVAATVIASVGLMTQSGPSVVASMLISPLMGPLLGIAFGEMTHDKELRWRGTVNEAKAVAVILVVSFLSGLAFSPFADSYSWPTAEMDGRGHYQGLAANFVVAVVSGAVAGVCVTGAGVNSNVGVAISASLLPPICNTGVCLAFYLLGARMHPPPQTAAAAAFGVEGTQAAAEEEDALEGVYSICEEEGCTHRPDEFVSIALWSFVFYLVNIVSILFMAVFVFKLQSESVYVLVLPQQATAASQKSSE